MPEEKNTVKANSSDTSSEMPNKPDGGYGNTPESKSEHWNSEADTSDREQSGDRQNTSSEEESLPQHISTSPEVS